MKRILLIVRMIFEAFLGIICLSDLLLLPGIWKDRDHIALALGELLAALIFILIGLLCLKDVVKIIRALRGFPIKSLDDLKLADHRLPTRCANPQKGLA
jgi:uncharacterized protein YacL